MIIKLRRLAKWLGWTVVSIIGLFIIVLVIFRFASVIREKQTRQEAAPATGRFVQANDVQLYIQEMGDPQNPAVLFIHGTGAWSETWKGTMKVVSEAGFYTVAVDMPPFGFSERPHDNSYQRTDQAKRLIALLDALHIQKVILVGHSYGGGATLETAMQAAGRVDRMVLIDVALALQVSPEEQQATSLVKILLSIGPLRNAFVSTTISNPLFTARLLRGFVKDPQDVTASWVKIYQQPIPVKGGTKTVGAWLPTLFTYEDEALSTHLSNYDKIAIPVHLIWGEKDAVTPLSQGTHLKEHITSSTLTILKDVGHIPQIEDPEALYSDLLQFLKSK
jgi:pimeloyl-ACP methyl ester carboxylesterase